jgi:isochorismate pyruvate lyase
MKECHSIEEVRVNIDRLDAQIVPLLAERSFYVGQAAKFKADKKDVVVPERIEQIILRVRHMAVENGSDPDLIERIYRSMLDAFIMFEAHVWHDQHAGA